MKYYIDQSIKIENTNKPTYVAVANGSQLVCSISAKDKQKLKVLFRNMNKPLIFKLFTFSVLCSIVIINSNAKTIIIDREYLGHEIDIKNYITKLLRLKNFHSTAIHFSEIGKHNNAHICCYNAQKYKYSDIAIGWREILEDYSKVLN